MTTPSILVGEPVALPDVMPGHWDTAEGAEMARECLLQTREDLTMGKLSDLALANAQFMVSRDSLDLIVFQTAAKERIRWLSAQLAAATAFQPAKLDGAVGELLTELEYLAENGSANSRERGAYKNAATAIEALSRELEACREALKPLAEMPCTTIGLEDLEPGCCASCRARAALHPTSQQETQDESAVPTGDAPKPPANTQAPTTGDA